MGVRPPRYQGGRQQPKQAVDAARGSARQRGYDRRWDRSSLAFRSEHPLCQYCEAGAFGPKRVSASTRTDHLYPQRRYPGVFWVQQWWVASCDACDAAKQSLEHQGHAALDRLALQMGRPTLRGG